MPTPADPSGNPRVFISYSWDSEDHKLWVESLATQLRGVGVDARLDVWRDENQSIDDFMMLELERADCVVAICTPDFKQKILSNAEGTQNSASGFEIGTAAAFRRITSKPIVPVLARGEFAEAAPSSLLGYRYYDFTQGDRHATFLELKDRLLGHTAKVPELGAMTSPAKRPPLPDIYSADEGVPGSNGRESSSEVSGSPGEARSQGKSRWLIGTTVVVALMLAVAFVLTQWPPERSDEPTQSHSDPRVYSLLLDKMILNNCEGITGARTASLLNAQDELCVQFNGTTVLGCDGTSFRCSRSEPEKNTHHFPERKLVLDKGANSLLIYEEDENGCRGTIPAQGTSDCRLMGELTYTLGEDGVVLIPGMAAERIGSTEALKPGSYEDRFSDEDTTYEYQISWQFEVD